MNVARAAGSERRDGASASSFDAFRRDVEFLPMPFAIYILGLAVFAQGTSEFMLSGLIPDIARELKVSIAAAGTLTSAFAAGMIVGAPLMSVLSLRWPRRRALLVFLIAFMLVHVVGAITTSFSVLLVTRALGALANAGFLAVGLTTATSMVKPNAKGRAISILLGGITLACIAGVPAGAVLGHTLGWRSAFIAAGLAQAVRRMRTPPRKDAPTCHTTEQPYA
jgi:DHA1 family chloramphenicol resistance protein-like MFS transporter